MSFRKEVCKVGRELSVGDRRRPESKMDLQPHPALSLLTTTRRPSHFISMVSFMNNGDDNRI